MFQRASCSFPISLLPCHPASSFTSSCSSNHSHSFAPPPFPLPLLLLLLPSSSSSTNIYFHSYIYSTLPESYNSLYNTCTYVMNDRHVQSTISLVPVIKGFDPTHACRGPHEENNHSRYTHRHTPYARTRYKTAFMCTAKKA